jgi:hypothetical protein
VQFKLVLLGALLLSGGLIAYSTLPNVHTTPILQTLPLPTSDPFQIPAGSVLEVPQNLSVVTTRHNTLLMNLTIVSSPGQSSSLLFQIFQKNETRSCPNTTERAYIFNQEVTNGSFRASIPSSGQYCFVFDNGGSMGAKTILLATAISSNFERIQVANDGEMNIVGLVGGALGSLILVAGFMKKTVIPWE